jgi:galactokinase
LSALYQVSCPELDFLVQAVKDNEAVMGARMMGGGFGGCTINIIRKDQVFPILSRLQESYLEAFGKELTHYMVSIEQGTKLIQ